MSAEAEAFQSQLTATLPSFEVKYGAKGIWRCLSLLSYSSINYIIQINKYSRILEADNFCQYFDRIFYDQEFNYIVLKMYFYTCFFFPPLMSLVFWHVLSHTIMSTRHIWAVLLPVGIFYFPSSYFPVSVGLRQSFPPLPWAQEPTPSLHTRSLCKHWECLKRGTVHTHTHTVSFLLLCCITCDHPAATPWLPQLLDSWS